MHTCPVQPKPVLLVEEIVVTVFFISQIMLDAHMLSIARLVGCPPPPPPPPS